MAFYSKLGSIPPKRHTQFRKANGALYAEELVSTEGFSATYSLIYHAHPPTLVKAVAEPYSVAPVAAIEKNLKALSLKTFKVPPNDDYLKSRVTLLFNNDLTVAVAAPTNAKMDYFYKNADADEMLFIHEGKEQCTQFMVNWILFMVIISFFPGEQFIRLNSKLNLTDFLYSNLSVLSVSLNVIKMDKDN